MPNVATVLRSVALGLTVGLAAAACTDTPSAPVTSRTARSAPPAGPAFNMVIDSSPSYSSGSTSVDNNTYLTYFLVTNCDPTIDPGCAPYCDVYDTSCTTQTIDNGYYELRQNLRRADGSQIAYNMQRWHGYIGALDQQVFSQRMCANSGEYIDLEIYSISSIFNIATRMGQWNIYPSSNGIIRVLGNGFTWTAHVRYSWATC